ncbi:hypothetical protein GcM3_045031 [Golovinomyces cichoracearum]|uniref:Uncharacterized protein n=1 Tax=Golovinomyces cichoracearum TaxID=62708 RepID=A0A420J0T4_9PEZI|nr:hypothetical protein GcM3_045031 [Golovinomyces cichoracearum]
MKILVPTDSDSSPNLQPISPVNDESLDTLNIIDLMEGMGVDLDMEQPNQTTVDSEKLERPMRLEEALNMAPRETRNLLDNLIQGFKPSLPQSSPIESASRSTTIDT